MINLVIQFISNIISTVFIAIIVVTLMNLVLLPAGSISCAIKTKNIKSGLRYIKRVIAGTCEETDKFFCSTSDSLKHIWRVK